MPIENEEEEVIGVFEDDFKVPKKRGFRSKKDKEEEKDEHERKTAICNHFKKARCHYGRTAQQESSPTMGFQSALFTIQ